MRGFELLKEHTNGGKLFEIWFDSLLSTLDGYSYTERKKHGAKGLSQKQLVDYTVSRTFSRKEGKLTAVF
jgi:hypothetical protein